MTKPTTKKVASTTEVKSTLDITQTNNNPVLGPSDNNPPINSENFVTEFVDNRTENVINSIKELVNEPDVEEPIKITEVETNPLESNLKVSYSITSEGRTITQLGRGGVKFATGFQNLTAVLETLQLF